MTITVVVSRFIAAVADAARLVAVTAPKEPLVNEPELTEPMSLTWPDGSLNRASVGWARRPMIDTSGIDGRRSWGRNKRWEYWNVMTPTHIVALTVSSLDYAAVHEVWVFDRDSGQAVHRTATGVLGGSAELPPVLGDGSARSRAKHLTIDVDEVPGGTRLRARIPGASVDVLAARPPGHECLAVVVPWSDKRFQYTVKDVCRPASGTITIGDRTVDVPAGESWAVLDHGRGRWPYDIAWNWGAGSGIVDGQVIGVQVGGQWTDGTGSTENAMLVGGRLHKISHELTWEYDLAESTHPWRIHGGGLDAVFTPFHVKRSSTRLGVLSSRTDQCFGHWSGSFSTPEVKVRLDGITGWVEDVHNRW
ncbi:DUF2804 domain-containing protein [Aeromicrobium wangtongii]|uniref:DUF2804 domain-containing protein n=1 Tax=Aeromicrobium wangtongii TaxID=2969247 RepID=UPI001E58F5EB|nr:DUF2804 domain-containing protein [Aeromicrobium wangtongii]MCD9199576.1 DUF2804 domain-containing protein [Aeromicrobium wangtongii]